MKKTILITGGSSGLGLAVAKVFRDRNWRVIITSRHNADPPQEGIEFIAADLSKSDGVEFLAAEVAKVTNELDLLVNNVGFGLYAGWEELVMSDLRRLFDVDFFASVELTRKMLPLLRRGDKPAIINISSVAGLMPLGYMGPYSAVKAAFWQFSESLRTELKVDNIMVSTIAPGRISTGFADRAITTRQVPHTPGGKAVLPEQFGKLVYQVYLKRIRNIVYPRWYKLAIWFARFCPGLYENLTIKTWKIQ